MSVSSCNEVCVHSGRFTKSYSRFFFMTLSAVDTLYKTSWTFHLLTQHHLLHNSSFQNACPQDHALLLSEVSIINTLFT
jgi:hypothetical protein